MLYCLLFKIVFEDRANEDWPFMGTLVVDGTNCPILEPGDFSPIWYSHKFNGPGVRYEIASSIQTGLILWTNGPFAAGLCPDDEIFAEFLAHKLYDDEVVHADRGYNNPDNRFIIFHPGVVATQAQLRANKVVRAWHETINQKFKKYKIISNKFRHNLEWHGNCFQAVASLVQLTMIHDEKPYEIHYEE